MGFNTKASVAGALCLLALTSCRNASSSAFFLWPEAGQDSGLDAGVAPLPVTHDASDDGVSDDAAPSIPSWVDAAEQPPIPLDAQPNSPPEAAALHRLRVGLQPGGVGNDAGAPGLHLDLLEALALGSHALTHVTLEPLHEAPLLRYVTQAAEVDVILTLPVSVDDASSVSDLPRIIDEAMALFEQDAAFSYLIVGERLDQQLERKSSAEQASFISAVSDALHYAQTHPARPTEVSVGIGLAAYADAGQDLPEMWVQGTQVYALSFDGFDKQGQLMSPDKALVQWQDSLQILAALTKPVIFQEVSYPSAQDPEAQRDFFAQLRLALAQPPDALAALVISTLNDPPRFECEAWAEQWFPTTMPADYRCSVGLHDQSGAKPALVEVLEILARHTTP